MGVRTRRNIGATLAAGLAIAGAVALTSTSASGVDEFPEATDPVFEPYGTLTIEVRDRDGLLTLDYDDVTFPSEPTVTQTIVTEQPCAQVGFGPVVRDGVILTEVEMLLALTPIVGGTTTEDDTVQLPDDGIGVNSGTNCGNPAGVISAGERLEIEPGSFVNPASSDTTVLISSADLVLGKRFNNSGDLLVDPADPDFPNPIAVQRGVDSVTVTPATPTPSLTIGSDSSREERGLALQGPTVLELVTLSGDFEVAVSCGEQVTDVGDPGEIAERAVFVRGANDPAKQDPDVACSDVGVTVEIQTDDPATPEDEDRVFWNNGFVSVEDGSDQATSGKITIFWAPAPVSSAGQPTQVDYDAEGPGDYVDAQFCSSFSEAPSPDGPTFTVDFPSYNGPGNISGEAPWCVVSRTDVINGDGLVERTEVMVGKGDPYGRFR